MYTLLRGVIRKILFGSTIRAVVGSNMVRRGPATSVTTRSMGGLRSYYIYTWDQIRRKEPLLHGVYIEDQEPQGPSVKGQAPRTMEEPLTKSRGPRAISRAKQNDFAHAAGVCDAQTFMQYFSIHSIGDKNKSAVSLTKPMYRERIMRALAPPPLL